ncbi:hypothetical protein [Flavobacterium sp.]|uniref:hypothetical protein n=1 Tax=Flavobacterium sp. TaxID=239 RepID=UPI0039E5188B
MSDFGSMITFAKKEGELTDDDKEQIVGALEQAIVPSEFPSNITGGNFRKLRSLGDNVYCVLITEYYDDEDVDEMRDDIEADDLQECERIIKKLELSLGFVFEMEAKFEDW